MQPILPPYGPLRGPPGVCVSVPTPFFIRHFGIVTDALGPDDAPMVISLPNAKGGVVEETWTEFASRNPVRVDGYPGSLPAAEVLTRARSCIGNLPWRFGFNCEHFVFWCHGLDPQSPQLENWIAAGGLGILLAKLWR